MMAMLAWMAAKTGIGQKVIAGILAAALLTSGVVAWRMYVANIERRGATAERVKILERTMEAADEARRTERDAARCLDDPECVLDDPFRKR